MSDSNHPLAHLVPNASYASKYFTRVHDGVKDLDILEEAFENKNNVLIVGPTGPGKTTLVYAFAALKGLPLVNISCNGAIEPRSFLGGWTPTPDGSFAFIPADALLAIMFGGVVYADEINMSPPAINAILHELTDDRRSISVSDAAGSDFPTFVEAHEDFFFVAAMNEGSGYRGTRDLNVAFRDRFGDTIYFDYVTEIERKLTKSKALIDFAVGVRSRIDVGDLVTPLSTRALIEFEDRALNPKLGFDYAVGNLSRKFKPEEREVITKLLELHSEAIKSELGLVEVPVISEEEPF